MEVSEISVSYSNRNKNKVKITNSKDAYKISMEHWNLDIIELQEETKVLLLNRANIVIGIFSLSRGGITSCVVDIKLILSVALKSIANSIILIHNHPSGNLVPSQSDIDLTTRLKNACNAVELSLLDHLIITKKDYYSFMDNGGVH